MDAKVVLAGGLRKASKAPPDPSFRRVYEA
jgi:hypothetical protein